MTDQLDFFSILDRVEIPNSAKPWCKSWLCALTNDVGVYVTNVHTYTKGEGYMAYLELKCALLILMSITPAACRTAWLGVARH